jgi:hypothetical protein
MSAMALSEIISLNRHAARSTGEALFDLGVVVKCLEEADSDLADDARAIRSRLVDLEDEIRRRLSKFEQVESIVRWV